jgi:hypothetical protein
MRRSRVAPLARSAWVAAAAITAAGCFVYRPAQPGGVEPGQVVRVSLTPSGAEQVTTQVGPRVTTLDGRVIGARDSTLAVAVTQLTRAPASEEFWTGDSVLVPVRGLSSVSVRELDRQRSVLATGGVLVALVVLRQVFIESGVFGSRPTPSPGSQ